MPTVASASENSTQESISVICKRRWGCLRLQQSMRHASEARTQTQSSHACGRLAYTCWLLQSSWLVRRSHRDLSMGCKCATAVRICSNQQLRKHRSATSPVRGSGISNSPHNLRPGLKSETQQLSKAERNTLACALKHLLANASRWTMCRQDESDLKYLASLVGIEPAYEGGGIKDSSSR